MSVFNAVVVVTTLVVFLQGTSGRKLPSYIKVCSRNDKNFDQCIMDSLENSKPYLAKGIPKVKLPALEPLYIPQLQINRDLDNIKIKANLKEIYAYGGTNFKFNKLKTNLEKHTLEARVTLPLIYVMADYDVDGRLLLVPLKGKGSFRGNISDIVVDVKGNADTFLSSKGVKYLSIKNLKTKIRVNGDPKVAFMNKDKDRNNELITQTALTFFNQNKKQVLDIVGPIAEETAEAFIEQVGNMVLRSIPYNELLPE